MTTKRVFPGAPDTDYHVFFEDFERFLAADWVITTTEDGTGSATEVPADVAGGVLVITNAAGDNDLDSLQWAGSAGATTENFIFDLTKKMQFQARFKVLEVIEMDLVIGLAVTDTEPFGGVADGALFTSDDGNALLNFELTDSTTAATTTQAAVATLVADTYVKVEFYYDGDGSDVDIFVDDVRVAGVAVTNLPVTTEMAITFGIRNGTTAANVLSLDYIKVVAER